MAEKKSRKELLKREDAFIHAAGESALWVKHHKIMVLGGGTALLLAIAAIIGVIEYGKAQDTKASALYASALELREATIGSAPESTDEAPDDASDGAPTFATEAERDQAVREAFQKVIDEAGHSGVATLARFYVADYDQKLGETDKALAAFLALADGLPATDSLYFLAVERAAYLKEQKGDVDGALSTWRRLLGNEKRFYSDHALFEMARLHADRGEADKARELLLRLETDYKDSPVQDDVKELFTLVGRPTAQASAAEPKGEQATP